MQDERMHDDDLDREISESERSGQVLTAVGFGGCALLALLILILGLIGALPASGSEIRTGVASSSGIGEDGAQPVMAVELDLARSSPWLVRTQVTLRGAEKLDGGEGWAGSAGVLAGREFGNGLELALGYEARRLDVDSYEIDTGSPILTAGAARGRWSWRLEARLPDDTPRETWSLTGRVGWRLAWASFALVDFGPLIGDGPRDQGHVFTAGVRWRW